MEELPDLVGVEREIGAKMGLVPFVRMAWPIVEPGRPYLHNWHIDVVAEHLEAVYAGQIRRLVINIPPGCMKSLLTSVFWPIWIWIREPKFRFICASYDVGITIRDARKHIQIMESEWFQERWGSRITLAGNHAGWNTAAGFFTNLQGGFRFSTSVGGPVTGRHADCQIIDDPIKPKDLTKLGLENCIEWWTRTMPSRVADPKTSRKVIIMQRLHDLDLAGYCIRSGDYDVLKLPMRYMPKACSYTSVGGDMRLEEGELLWPERFPVEEVSMLEKEMTPNTASAQFQQDPVPEGGGIFQQSWFQRWTKATLPVRFDDMCQTWDCAFKGTSTSDFVVGQVWGRIGPNYYLLDQERGRFTFPQTLDAIRRLTLRWPGVVAKLVEDKANGPAVVSTLEKEIPGVIAVDPQGGKEARANAVAPLYAARNVFHPDPTSQPWVVDYEQELLRFPFGVNDDCVDATTQGLSYLYAKKSGYWEALSRIAASMPKLGR